MEQYNYTRSIGNKSGTGLGNYFKAKRLVCSNGFPFLFSPYADKRHDFIS